MGVRREELHAVHIVYGRLVVVVELDMRSFCLFLGRDCLTNDAECASDGCSRAFDLMELYTTVAYSQALQSQSSLQSCSDHA